ncbi:MAG TPA: Ig-like domain-containing protein, partial [Candidatus Limnocylindrales bacterium]|nr:Ig-like domain-containing protein [Candidatus Limnocylindrales bacterium]
MRREWAARLRRDWRSWLTSRTGSGIVTAIVVVALVVTATSNGLPAPTGEPSGGPSATPRPNATPAATTPPDEAWGDLALPAWEPVAELRPVSVNTSGVAVDSAFLLRSRTSVGAADLAARLTADPSITFEVRPGATAAEATVIPSEPLAEGVLYRIRLADPTGALAGSWAYRTERPLHVVGTVPANETTGVPVDTGIEVEFDQDGVAGLGDRFSIDPAVTGRFEVHGRTIAFVPNAPLAPATVYRFTVAAGVTMTGSDQVLEAPLTVAFETAAPAGTTTSWDVGLGRPILEATPGEAPIIGVDLRVDDSGPAVGSLPFEVYRLESIDAARAAAVTLANVSDWAEWGTNEVVPTTGLPRVAAFDGAFESSSPYGYRVVRFPAPLDAGWYLVVIPREGRDRQALLQVTSLSAFALTSDTRTLAWVNDTVTDQPIADAAVDDPDGLRLGTTAASGLLDVETPESLRHPEGVSWWLPSTSILTVTAADGRQLLVALGLRSNTSAYPWARNDSSRVDDPNRRWWRLLATDRSLYRSVDTVHAWGLLRSRLDGSVPDSLELTLRADEGSSEDGPWLARIPIAPTVRGTWAADIPIDDLPLGGYIVELHAPGGIASSTWLSVGEIRKPAYRIEVETDRRAVIAGDPVAITGRAVFFDGTPAAGLDLQVHAFERSVTATTDADGRVAVTVEARTGADGGDYGFVDISPVHPEEGEIAGSAIVYAFPSAAWITASGTVTGGRVEVSGALRRVDLERAERQLAEGGWPDDPGGSP